MGGGGFLLTDVARWVPGRHEVPARLALLEALGIEHEGDPRVVVHASDRDRVRMGRWLREAWPLREPRSAAAAVAAPSGAWPRGRSGHEPFETPSSSRWPTSGWM